MGVAPAKMSMKTNERTCAIGDMTIEMEENSSRPLVREFVDSTTVTVALFLETLFPLRFNLDVADRVPNVPCDAIGE